MPDIVLHQNELESVTWDELDVDPYPTYRTLREQAPVAYLPGAESWVVSTWDDCASIDANPAIEHRDPITDEFFGTPNVMSMSGDEHRRMRVGIDATLRPRALRSRIEASRPVLIEYIEKIRPLGRADLVTELFERISVRIVGDYIGLADIDDETLLSWYYALMNEPDDATVVTLDQMQSHLREKIARLRNEPDDSVISHMLHDGLDVGQPPRDFDDIMPTVRVILLGGFLEPSNSISNTFFALFSERQQLAELVANPAELSGPALEEGLRWMSPIGATQRTVRDDIEVHGVVIPAGAVLQISVASANHDESRYEHPEKFDLHRPPSPHAAFGHGAHHCAGHAIARWIGTAVIEEVVTRLPGLRPAPDTQAAPHGWLSRGVKSLPAVWDA
ncbi:cytochrome P450 [Leifsonia kafniensis]|uniref:Cytochrome P450 n=1 Tax=Leifsonia kafniensis TaxID=475957 RepID=A0ABP7KMR8_9MICO